MEPPKGRTGIARFGTFTLDLEKKELRRAGRIIRLRGQPFEVLVALLERPGSVVARDDLHKRLWGENTFVDFEHGLNKAISKIRGALGDAAENPRFLETAPGEGYRFVAPVEWIPSGVAGQPESTASSLTAVARPSTSRHVRRWVWGAAVAATLALTGVGGLYIHERHAKGLVETKLTSRVPDLPVECAALSPDGKYLAFSDSAGLWIQVVSKHEMHRLEAPANSAITRITWMPDSSSLLLSATANTEKISGLWEVSIFGGAPHRLRDDAGQGTPSPDGMKIAFTGGDSKEIWTVSNTGEDPQRIAIADQGEEVGGFVWSGDSRSLVYKLLRLDRNSYQAKLKWRNLESGKTTVVLSEEGLRGFCGTGDGVLVYSRMESPANTNDMNLWKMRIDMYTGEVREDPKRITEFQGYSLSSLSITSDGRSLAVDKGMSHIVTYVLGLGPNGDSRGAMIPLTFHDRDDYPGTWDGSSRAVYLNSNRDGVWEIFEQDITRRESEYVVGSTQNAKYPVLSPDGRWILYQAVPKSDTNWSTPIKLLRVPVSGGPPQEAWKGEGFYRVACTRLPENRCVLATRGADGASIVLSEFDPLHGKGKDLRTMTARVSAGTVYLSWALSPDGSEVALCEAGDMETLVRVASLKGAPEQRVMVRGWRGFESIRWTADGKGFFLLMGSDNGSTVLRVDGEGHARVLLERNREMHPVFAPSPDGRWLALAELDSTTNVSVLSGF
jgi:DNA-binding winged helix-turn-helix (wHTH) protein/Tol biopolymer transport system component